MVFDDRGYPPLFVRVRVDANNQPDVWFVIHELLHVMFAEMFRNQIDDATEEVMIVALSNYHFEYAKKASKRLLRWRELIERKLEHDAANKPQDGTVGDEKAQA